MTINGKPIAQDQFSSFPKLNITVTPESEAEFNEREKQRLQEEEFERINHSNKVAGIPKKFWNVSFSDFPSEHADKAKKLAVDYSSSVVYLLFGDVGRGKTHTLCCGIHERAKDRNWDSLYYNIRNLRIDLASCRNYLNGKDELTFMEKLTTVPFLCLDEVGTCSNRQWESEFLNDLLCERCDNLLPTWIATNLSPVSFKALICNQDINNLSTEDLVNITKEMDATNPTLNRIKSVAIVETLTGKSYRGVYNGDSSSVLQ